ncbi:MAG: diguanylate cyclase [Bermanella sp.]|nr:diguanylate cyclase [Bermanella sp.]
MTHHTPAELLTDQPKSPHMAHKVWLIVSLFSAIIVVLLGLGYFQSETLNGVRAFVHGEGLWSKAQKDATYHLERFARSQDLSDYDSFQQALNVNLGDKSARLALAENPPDITRARMGFLAGDNHPDDIDSMIEFFTRFQSFYYMKTAIGIWEKGDNKIQELQILADQLHHCVINSKHTCVKQKLEKLKVMNFELNTIGRDFSLVLSASARWIKSTLLTTSIIIISLLALIIFIITRNIIFDLTATQQKLANSEKRFLSLYQSNVIGIMEWHINGQILAANQAFLDTVGYSNNDVKQGFLNWKKITPDAFNMVDEKAIKELHEKGSCTPFEKQMIHKNGHHIHVYIGATLLTGDTERGICFVVDQSLQKSNETQLRLSATVFDASSDGIIITDQYKHIVAVNGSYCKKIGTSQEQLIGSTPQLLVSQYMPDGFYEDVSKSLQEQDHWQGDLIDSTTQGETIPVHVSINTVKDRQYKVSHYVFNITDISERKAIENQLFELAHHDYLTGLANRSLYEDRLNQALLRGQRNQSHCALLFFDLDKFKPINDQYGHEVGDQVLQAVAARLNEQVRSHDTVARLGGDEFIIVLEDLNDSDHAAQLAEKIIKALSKPYLINDLSLSIGCSVGISISPQDGNDSITLTRNADHAMYDAKAVGTNRYSFYSPFSLHTRN